MYFSLQDEKQKLTDEKRAHEMRIGFLETDLKTLKEKQTASAQNVSIFDRKVMWIPYKPSTLNIVDARVFLKKCNTFC